MRVAWVGLSLLTGCGAVTSSDDVPAVETDAVVPTDRPVDTDHTDEGVDSDDTDDSDAPPGATRFDLGPEQPCADPAARATLPYAPWAPLDAVAQTFDVDARPLFAGGGLAVADIDEDGVMDLFRTSDAGGFAWLALRPEGAVDRTAELPPIPAQTGGVTAVDGDGDGDLDLHITVWQGPDLFLRQDTDGWHDVAAAWGLAGLATDRSVGASWADADGDGDLDVFIGVHGLILEDELPDGDPSHLFVQEAPGRFVDLVPALPDRHGLRRAHTFQGGWVELDGDPTPELYVVNDFGFRFPNAAYEVVGGAIVELPARGFEGRGTHMGLGIGDFGRDGLDDLVVPEIDDVFVWVSQGALWFEAADVLGIARDPTQGRLVGWGAEVADLDADGDLDVLVQYGQLDEAARIEINGRRQRDGAWIQDDGFFTDLGPAWGLDQRGIGRGLVVADVDRDGWLDVVKQDLAGPTQVLQGRCGASGWLAVDLRQPGPNPFGVGARVVVVDGAERWSRTVRAGGTGYASAGPPEVHVGVGDRESVERLEVHWPDGTVDIQEDVPVRRRVRAVRAP